MSESGGVLIKNTQEEAAFNAGKEAGRKEEKAGTESLRTDAYIMANYLADYQTDEAEDRRCCVSDLHHQHAKRALETAYRHLKESANDQP